MAEPIDMPFWMKTRVGPRNHVLSEDADLPRRSGNFRVLSGLFKSVHNLRCCITATFAAKGIIQSPIASCSRIDHSVC